MPCKNTYPERVQILRKVLHCVGEGRLQVLGLLHDAHGLVQFHQFPVEVVLLCLVQIVNYRIVKS